MDKNEMIEGLIAAGFTKEKATKKVEETVEYFTKKLAGSESTTIENAIAMGYKKILNIANASKVRAVVIGSTNLIDKNGWLKRRAEKAYETDASRAVAEGLVAVDDEGTITYIDNREFLDGAQTIPNRNFGKPIAKQEQREIVLVTNRGVEKAFANVDVEIGREYDFYGSQAEGKNVVYVNRKPKPTFVRTLRPVEFWEGINDVMGTVEEAVPLCDVFDKENYEFVITKGMIHGKYVNDFGSRISKSILLRSDECPDGIFCSVSSDVVDAVFDEVDEGYEVIVVGNFNKYTKKDGTDGCGINMTGLVYNPDSSQIADALGDFEDVVFGGE
jgi:hypothetical protein